MRDRFKLINGFGEKVYEASNLALIDLYVIENREAVFGGPYTPIVESYNTKFRYALQEDTTCADLAQVYRMFEQ